MAKIRGTKDSDFLIGTEAFDSIYGLGGADTIFGSRGDDELYGGAGSDNIFGSDGDELIHGGAGSDFVFGVAGNDTVDGGAGDDSITLGRDGNSSTFGGSGADRFGTSGVYGNNYIDGGSGFDILDFGSVPMPTPVAINFGTGIVQGGNADGSGMAHVASIEGAIGGELDDILIGDASNNHFSGRGGNDVISGDDGNDTLVGLNGNDILTGGKGSDTFIWVSFPHIATDTGADVVTDFASGEDTLAIFAEPGFGLGLNGRFLQNDGRFYSASGADAGNDETDRIIYDSSSGNVYLDLDGNGAGQAILMFTLAGRPALDAKDIALQAPDFL